MQSKIDSAFKKINQFQKENKYFLIDSDLQEMMNKIQQNQTELELNNLKKTVTKKARVLKANEASPHATYNYQEL